MISSKKWTAVSLAAAAALLVPATAASAGGGSSSAPKLDTFNCVSDGAIYGACDTVQPGTAGWTKADAPGDTDGWSLALTTADETTGVSYVGVNVLNTAMTGQTLAQVTKVGFDTSGFAGGGAPRISLVMDDGNVVWLDPATCSVPLSNGWVRADFRDATEDAGYHGGEPCTINSTYGTFTSGVPPVGQSGTQYTAWNWLNQASSTDAAHPAHISQVLLVQDWGPGTSHNDNLTFDSTVITAQPGQAKKS